MDLVSLDNRDVVSLEALGDALNVFLDQLNIVDLAAMRALGRSWKISIDRYAAQCTAGNVVYLNRPVDFFVHKRIYEILKRELNGMQYVKSHLCKGNLHTLKLMSEWYVARLSECFRVNLKYFDLTYHAQSADFSNRREISNVSISKDIITWTKKLNSWIHKDQAKLLKFDKLVFASYISLAPLTAFKQLQTFVIKGSFFFHLPLEICLLTGLTLLTISHGEFSDLPSEIGNLTNLTSLSFPLGKLASLTAEVGQLTNLTHLNLESNQLRSLPSETGLLTKLRSLDLNFNHIHVFPEEACNLVGLEYLAVQDSNLTSIPVSISKLTNLNYLNIRCNEISTLPPSIRALNLEKFYYGHNSKLVDFWAKILFSFKF